MHTTEESLVPTRSMKHILAFFFITFACAIVGPESSPAATSLTLDGRLDDPFWQSVPVQNLSPSEEGVPDSGGTVRVKQYGRYLCFAMHLPEPGGKVLARSIGRNPIWQKDATNAPAVEDRVVYALRYRSAGGALRDLTVSINPWQAYRVEESDEVVPSAEILRATDVNSEGWTVEAAVPTELIDADWASEPTLELRVERIRSRRALAPEHRWAWPGGEAFSEVTVRAPQAELALGDVPEVRAPVFGNMDPALEVGRVVRVPSAVADWEDPAWSGVSAVPLARNEPLPRVPTYQTRFKWMHDGNTLALFLYAEEPEPVVAGPGGRDGPIGGDDRISIYLATSGSRFLEISVNSAGAVRDALGGGPRLRRPDYSWDGDFDVETDMRRGSWIVRLNIPLAQCSAALGDADIPDEWRVLIARHRVARRGEVAEVSTLPALEGSSSFVGPARYRKMILSKENPASVKLPHPAYGQVSATGFAATIANLPSNVWSSFDRQYLGIRRMVDRDVQRRLQDVTLAERRAWEKVETREDWESFRDKRMEALRNSLGEFPPQRPPLDVRVSARHGGKAYQLENIAFQSRPGYYVTANLYLPERPKRRVPGIIIVHSQHAPKAEWELHDSAEVWARAGSAVLIVERPGYGERTETNPWYRQAYASRFTFTKQLYLVGESYSAWSAWDVMRSVDFLLQRPEVDPNRIIVIGAVASGGAVAGLAASLDSRVAAVIPYNFDQGHLRVHGDLRGQVAGQFSPWLISASMAPRKFVRAFEFAWEGSEESDVPSLWVDGMSRSEKVWGFYNARDSVAEIQGFGLLRDQKDRRSPCRNLGPEQREGIYPVLERWFGIPKPSAEDCAILPNSELSTNMDRESSRQQEAKRLRPVSDLLSIPPELSTRLSRKALHQVAFDMGKRMLHDARAKREGLVPKERAQQLREELRSMLGDIEPTTAPKVDFHWKRSLANVQVEALSLTVEENIHVPLLLFLPQGSPLRGVVVAVAKGGGKIAS